jgi:hypothetical protein
MSKYRMTWAWVCSNLRFSEFRNDPKFISLARLARVVNSLRFCQGAAYSARDNSMPEGRRQRSSAFLFTCVVLYEGFKVVRESGQYLGNYKAYRDKIIPLSRNTDVRSFINSIVKTTRNRVSFHFDAGVIADSIPDIELPEYRFVSGFGDRAGDTFYELADDIVVHSIVKHWKRSGDHVSKLNAFVTVLAEIMVLFVDAADTLIIEALDDLGWLQVEK